MKKNSFIEGTIIAYLSILFTKVLGAIYVIPFYKVIGEDGGVLYAYAYNVYNLFLNISVSGIPTAVAIIIAEYNTLKMYNEREKTFTLANKLIGIISAVCFIIMFSFAKYIGLFFVGGLHNSTDINSITLVIRTISFCILIIPFLSVLRGYLQGNKYFNPSSISQMIEQVLRIIIVLVGSYIAINVLHYSVDIGVAVALSGTVIGGLGAYLYLLYKKRKMVLEKGNSKESKVTNKELIKKILILAIPIVIISVTQNLYELADMKLIIKGLYMIGYTAEKSEYLASIVITWTPKICMVINALAIGLCSSIIPFIVSSFVNNDYKELNKKFNQAINIIFAVSIPLSTYIMIYARYIYKVFYGASNEGAIVLVLMAFTSILFSLQLLVNMILQGMKKFKMVYLNTFFGFGINIFLDIPVILFLSKINFYPYLGSLLATIIGIVISMSIVFISLKKQYKFSYKSIISTIFKSILGTVLMYIVLVLIRKYIFFDTNRYLLIVELGITGIIGVITYFFASKLSGLLDEVFGENLLSKITSKFKRGKKNED